MVELRFSFTIAIISILFSLLSLCNSYINGSSAWISIGISSILTYLAFSLDDTILRKFSYNLNLPSYIQRIFWLSVLFFFFLSALRGLLVFSNYFLASSFYLNFFFVIIMVILMIGTLTGLYQKIHFNIR